MKRWALHDASYNTGKHKRNTAPMLASARCGARTCWGPCCSPAVSGKNRCRMHGGAPGSGAPRGNTNALKQAPTPKRLLSDEQQFEN